MGLIGRVILEHRFEGYEAVSHVHVQEMSIAGQRDGHGKSLHLGTCLQCGRNMEEAREAGRDT